MRKSKLPVSFCALLLAACGEAPTQTQGEPVTVVIHEGQRADALRSPAPGAKGSRVKAVRMQGGKFEFFEDELIVHVQNEAAFERFLRKYDAQVLDDGTIPLPPPGAPTAERRAVPQREWRLVRVHAPDVDTRALAKKLTDRGHRGTIEFEDQATANLYDLALELENSPELGTSVNYAMHSTAVSSRSVEHYTGDFLGYFRPALDWALYNMGTTQLWDDTGVSGAGVDIAFIDVGFTPDDWDLTGYDPVTKTWNYRYVYQYDFAEKDYNVSSADGDPDPNGTTWHGHGVAAVALAAQNNHYGVSGVAPNASPMLFRVGRGIGNAMSYYDAGVAVDTAVAWGAEVISMSFIVLTPGGAGVPNTYLGAALQRADNAGVINVAAMGNDNRYTDNNFYPWFLYPIPGSWPTVIGVGATTKDNTRAIYSNYGPATDIWAPGEVLSVGPGPKSSYCYFTAERCANYSARETFNGTSAATPYVAGAVAMMKQVRPSLNRQQALSYLQSMSQKNSTDGTVNDAGIIHVYLSVWMARGGY